MIEKSKIVLPKLSDEELLKLYNKIKPIVYDEKTEIYYLLNNYDLYNLRWGTFFYPDKKDILEELDINQMDKLGSFDCFHKCKTYRNFPVFSIFNPTIAEVLEQFPDYLLDESNAFSILDYPNTPKKISEQHNIIKMGYHKSTVQTLKLKR